MNVRISLFLLNYFQLTSYQYSSIICWFYHNIRYDVVVTSELLKQLPGQFATTELLMNKSQK